jgi:hypothetical protein
MNFEERLKALLRAAVYLTVAMESDNRDVANYIDDIPEFLIRGTYNSEDDDLLDQFMKWVSN